MKPLVIAPTTLLKNQWVEEFEGCGIPREDIATRIWDAPDKKVESKKYGYRKKDKCLLIYFCASALHI